MKVSEAMVTNPVIIEPNASVFEAAKLMGDEKIGSVIVIENDRVIGIVTERDLVRRVIADNKDPKMIKIRDIMSAPVVSISPKEDILAAAQLMKNKNIRRLTVMENEKLVGVITSNDLVSNMKRVVDDIAITLYMMDLC